MLTLIAILLGALNTSSFRVAAAEQAIVFGHSTMNRPLVATLLGQGPETIVVIGGTHGDEPASPELVRHLLSFAREHPAVVDGRTLAFIERLNPDGLVVHTRCNARGVDLNRNLNAAWKRGHVGARYYSGPAPFSEPESRALRDLLIRLKPSRIVSIHSPMHCVNADGPGAKELATEMASLTRYPFKQDIGHPTPGSLGKWCAEHQIALVTLELPPISPGRAWIRCRASLLFFLKGLRGSHG